MKMKHPESEKRHMRKAIERWRHPGSQTVKQSSNQTAKTDKAVPITKMRHWGKKAAVYPRNRWIKATSSFQFTLAASAAGGWRQRAL